MIVLDNACQFEVNFCFWVIRMRSALVTQNKRIIYSATNVNRYVNSFKGFSGLRDEDLASGCTLADDVDARRQLRHGLIGLLGDADNLARDVIDTCLCARIGGYIRNRSGGADGQVASHIGDNEASERGIILGFATRHRNLRRVGTVGTGEVGGESFGEGVEIARRYLFGKVVCNIVTGDFVVVGKYLNRQLWEVDDGVAIALVILRTIVAHHLGERGWVLHMPLEQNLYRLEDATGA